VQNLKPRDFDPVGAFTLEGRPHIDETGDFKMILEPGTAGTLKEHQPMKGLVDAHAGEEIARLHAAGKSIRDIANAVKLSRSVVGRYVTRLVRDRGSVAVAGTVPCPTHNKPDEPNP